MKRFGLICLSLLLAGLTACAPRHPVPLSSGGVMRDPALVHGVLANGFQYILMENQTPKDRVSIHLNVFAGSAHETDAEQGVAHYLEHLLFNGSEHFKPGELIKYFQSIGMDFGADANASTSFFHTVYDLKLPKGDKAHLEDALVVIQDYTRGALLLEEEVDRERGIILAEKRERDSVSFRTFQKEIAFELPGSLLGRRLPIGIEPVIEKADRSLLKSFYDRWYRPDNMLLVLVGDMDAKEAERLIRERFAKLYPRKTAVLAEPSGIAWTPHKGLKAFHHYEPEAGNTNITIERISYTEFTRQTPDRLKQDVLKELADGIMQNRLSAMVRKQAADFTSASVYSGRFLRHADAAAISAECEPENWESSLVQLEQTLRQGIQFGFYPKELERVKSDYITRLDTAVKQVDTRKTPQLSRQILRTVQNRGLFLSPQQKRDMLVPYIQSLTLDQVNRAFKVSWQSDHRLVLVSGNADVDPGPHASATERIRSLFRESGREPVTPYTEIESKPFPYLSLPGRQAGINQKRENLKNIGVTAIDLNNNVRINLKPTDFKKGEFLFKVTFGPGSAGAPLDKPGIVHMAQACLNQSGLGAMDPDQLGEALAGRDANIGFSINDTYFSLSGSAAPDEAELVFQLIYAYLKDPGFRPQGLDLAKNHYRQMFAALERTPDGVMQIRGDRFLAENDPRFGLPHPDTASQISLGDIRNWLMPYFISAPIEVSFVGDFNPGQVTSLAVTYLGSLPERTAGKRFGPDTQMRVGFPGGKTLDLSLDTKIDKGMVRVAFLTDDFWDINRTRRLSMLARVMSERLRVTIRENLGASYSPYVYNDPSMGHEGYGVMQAVVSVQPGNADRISRIVEQIAGDIRNKGITQEEVDLVLKPVLTHLKVLKQSNNYWLNSVLADSLNHPERLAWSTQIIPDYSAITAKDLNRLAQIYLDPDKAALIRILPKN